jgi:hypothetical protein
LGSENRFGGLGWKRTPSFGSRCTGWASVHLERMASAVRAEPPRAKVRGWIARKPPRPRRVSGELPTCGSVGDFGPGCLSWRRCLSGPRPATQLAGVSRSHEWDPIAFRRCPARLRVSFGRCVGSNQRLRDAVGWRVDWAVPPGTATGRRRVARHQPHLRVEQDRPASSTLGARPLRGDGAPGAVRLFGVLSRDCRRPSTFG